jgi:hypothetical protein
LTKCLRSEIALNSPPIANENAAFLFWRQLRHGVDSGDPEAGAMIQPKHYCFKNRQGF